MISQHWDELSDRLVKALESRDPDAYIASLGDPELAQLFAWHKRAGDFLQHRRAPPDNPWIGRLIQGRYRPDSILGRGGSGVVFRARDEQIAGRWVVIKLLHDFWASEDWMRERFRSEAAVLARLDHPGIVSLIDAAEVEDGQLFLVFPFHEGRSLREALTAGPLGAPFAARLFREVGDAIGYSHRQGVLHRDLKPENVLLVRRADGEHPLVIDFGIAQIGDPTISAHTTTHLMGSAAYMAPEHLMGKPVAASDVYSLGVIAWELLAGARPFDSVSPFALPELQRRGTGDTFYRLRPDLGTAVGKLLAGALAFDAARRPAPITAFAHELADTLLTGGLDSQFARLWVLRRSRRWLLCGGTTALMGAAAGGWWLRDRLAPLAPGERAIELPLPSDPLAHGFRAHGLIESRVLYNSDSSGFERAIRVGSTDQGSYYYPLSRARIRAANRLGWKIDFEAVVEEGQIFAQADILGAPQRYAVNVYATPNQPDTVCLLTRITPVISGIKMPLDGPPGTRHRYRLEFNAPAAVADLWVDGVKRITGYGGLNEFRDYRDIEIGANRYHSARGSGIFSSFRFEIG